MDNKLVIPRYNAAAFTLELYDVALSIITRHHDRTIDDVIERYCLGWAYSNDTVLPHNGKPIALMFEDEEGNKSWFHYYRTILERDYIFEGIDPVD